MHLRQYHRSGQFRAVKSNGSFPHHQVIMAPIDDPMERDLAIFDLYDYDNPTEVRDLDVFRLGLAHSNQF